MPNAVQGLPQLIAALNELGLTQARAAVADVLLDMGIDAATYPSELPGQRYRRTGRLGEGWEPHEPTVSAGGRELTALLDNDVPYGPHVMGDSQAAVHQGRWQTEQSLLDESADRFVAAIEAHIGDGW